MASIVEPLLELVIGKRRRHSSELCRLHAVFEVVKRHGSFWEPLFADYLSGLVLLALPRAVAIAAVERRIQQIVVQRGDEPWVVDDGLLLAMGGWPRATADRVLAMLLPAADAPEDERRAKAVFCLRCVAETRESRQAHRVFAAAFASCAADDAATLWPKTQLDKAVEALCATTYVEDLKAWLLKAQASTRGEAREHLSRVLMLAVESEEDKEPADDAVARLFASLASPSQADRVLACARLTSSFYQSCRFRLDKATKTVQDFVARHPGRATFVDCVAARRSQAVQALVAMLATDDDTVAVEASFALLWATESRCTDTASYRLDDDAMRRVVLDYVADRSANRDPAGQVLAAHVLAVQPGRDPATCAHDYVQDWAVVADGVWPQWALPKPPPPVAPPRLVDALTRLDLKCGTLQGARVSLALGRLGVFDGARPASHLQQLRRSCNDEHFICLALSPHSPDTTRALLDAWRTRDDKHGHLKMTACLALIGHGDFHALRDALKEEVHNPPPRDCLTAFLFGLAGLVDPRGRTLVRWCVDNAPHDDPALRAAAQLALDKLPRWLDHHPPPVPIPDIVSDDDDTFISWAGDDLSSVAIFR